MDEIIYSNLSTKAEICAAGVNDRCGCFYLRCTLNNIPGTSIFGYYWAIVNLGNPLCLNNTIYGNSCTDDGTCGCVNYPDQVPGGLLCDASEDGVMKAYACPESTTPSSSPEPESSP